MTVPGSSLSRTRTSPPIAATSTQLLSGPDPENDDFCQAVT